jgi:hypothetical protein
MGVYYPLYPRMYFLRVGFLLNIASLHVVNRLPRSICSVTITYLNSSATEDSELESLSVEKDHPVVAGNLPGYV